MSPRQWMPVVNVIGLVCLVAPALCMTGFVAWWARGLSSIAKSARRGEFCGYRRVRRAKNGSMPLRSAEATQRARRWKQQF